MLSRPRIDGRKIPPTALRRPGEYLEDSKAAVDDICGPVMPQCIDGGILGDKWLMCAASILSEDEARVKEMFAEGKPEEKRLGAYRVSINKNGWWNTVLLDDFLPSVNGVPCYARVLDNPAELWVSLLQKAYAKVHNSYASITGGDSALALRDFTGAPSHRFDAAWVSATRDGKGADAMLDKLERYTEAGNIV
ncbi:cytoskeleton-associated protein CAP5.5, partial [Trypanosoma grayi]|uniref:cytoskeleton-associated protein CAP5.5 n=1 Tax=Trypanosoma grayi TaxID=71804 RepID=UPI0004F3FEA9